MKTFLWGFAIAVALSACGGGGGSTDGAPAPPQPTAPEPAIIFDSGIFFRQTGQVFIGQRLIPRGVLPGNAAPSWRVIGNSADPNPVFGTTADGNLNFVPGIGTYQIELAASPQGPALAKSTVKVIPQQIEFVVDVSHAGGTTQIVVRPSGNVDPMGPCFAYNLKGCDTPAFVEVALDGSQPDRLQLSNGTATVGGTQLPAYVVSVPTSSLSTATHALRVKVQGRFDTFGSMGGRSRQAFLTFDTTGPAQVGALGVLDANAENDFLATSSTSGLTARIGETISVQPSLAAYPTPTLVETVSAYRFVEKPPGSVASIRRETDNAYPASFVADKPGRYSIEYVPRFSEPRTASPAYGTVVVVPHQVTMTLTVSGDPAAYDDVPVLAAGKLRVAAEVTLTRSLERMEALLDGQSIGMLSRWNLQRYPGTVCYPYVCPRLLYAFDLDKASLGSTSHTLVIRVTDYAGFTAEVAWTIAATSRREEALGPFYDLRAPIVAP